MSSALPTRTLVSYTYAADRHVPSEGEVVVIRLSQDLHGPGSTLASPHNLPSGATRRNYHHAVILEVSIASTIQFTVFPMPAYSTMDPNSGLSSTRWLLSQPTDFQERHIPMPYEQISSVGQLNPSFPNPARFGDPIEAGGWKHSRPSWVVVVPQVADLQFTTRYKCFNPPVKLSADEVRRLKVYGDLIPSPIISSSGDGYATSGFPAASALGNDTIPGSGSSQHAEQDNENGGTAFGAGGSSALQALYATHAVKRAFARLSYRDQPTLILDSDDDHDDEDWEDNMDPITFARYYAPQNPYMAKVVQDHDNKMRERLDKEVTSWAERVQPETS